MKLEMRSVTNLFLVLVISVLASFVTGCSGSSSASPKMELTNYTKFYLLDGEITSYEMYKGKTIAIQFWGAYCNFSKGAIEHFNDEAKRLRNRKDIVFLAVSLDDDRDLLMRRIEQEKLDAVTHVYSGNGGDDQVYLAFGAEPIPHAVLITPDGKITHQGRKIDLGDL